MRHFYPYLFSFALLLPFLSLNAQDHECGTMIHPEQQAHLREFDRKWRQFQPPSQLRSGTNIYMVPVQLHILRKSDGSDGLSIAEYEAALDRVNELYLPIGIQFFQCNAVNIIDDDTYSPYNSADEAALIAAHSVSNVINIYTSVQAQVTTSSGTFSVCGYAYFPGGQDFVVLANSCTNNGSTFAHELGHYFALYHTHQGGNELVDGSNCTGAGDLLCDTPADPNLSGEVDTDCSYIGTDMDINGQSYTPQVSNLMSYASKQCRVDLSPDQYNRMLLALTTSRSYLSCTGTVNLEAEFAADTEADCADNLAVQFCDLSEGSPTAWSWDFGDGNTSTSQHPNHSYTAAGIYDVSLTVTRGGSSDTKTYNAKIKVGTVGIPYTNDFETATALNQWQVSTSMKNNIIMDATAAYSGSMGLMMEGDGTSATTYSPYYQTPASGTAAFGELQNPYFKTKMEICVDANGFQNLNLAFDLRQMYNFQPTYTNFRVLVNGSQVGSVYTANTGEAWSAESIDLSAFDNSSFTLAFEASHKYSDAGGNATYLDNINLTGTAVLPVEYASFTVAQQDAHVQLDWATLSESNNKGFDVLRSSDQENWQSLGFVPANTTNEATKNYQFMDWQAASQPSEKIYYQLRQVDFDGRTELSDIREVRLQRLGQLLAYPNPSQGELTVIVPQSEQSQVILQVSDLSGRLILEQKGAVDFTGLNQAFRLDLKGRKAGIYLLQVRNGLKHYTQKIVLE